MIGSLKYKAISFLGNYPELYFPLFSNFGTHKYRSVNASTDIVIEGFPRSANSYAVEAFRIAQEKKCKIATHIHYPCQVIQAVRLKKPTLVLVRDPVSAVISLSALFRERVERNIASKDEYMPTFSELFQRYATFYNRIMHLKSHVVIAKFDDVINHYGDCIARVNSRFKTSFVPYQSTPETDDFLMNQTRFHLAPNRFRDSIKSGIKKQYNEDLPKFKSMVDRAYDAYHAFIEP